MLVSSFRWMVTKAGAQPACCMAKATAARTARISTAAAIQAVSSLCISDGDEAFGVDTLWRDPDLRESPEGAVGQRRRSADEELPAAHVFG
jgi:hypothetical protein